MGFRSGDGGEHWAPAIGGAENDGRKRFAKDW